MFLDVFRYQPQPFFGVVSCYSCLCFAYFLLSLFFFLLILLVSFSFSSSLFPFLFVCFSVFFVFCSCFVYMTLFRKRLEAEQKMKDCYSDGLLATGPGASAVDFLETERLKNFEVNQNCRNLIQSNMFVDQNLRCFSGMVTYPF